MVMCNTMMDSLVIPRPPAPPLGPLVPTNYPLKGSPLPAPPPPPKPPSHIVEVQESDTKTTYSQLTRESGGQHFEERKMIEERRITQKMVEKNITRNESVRSRLSNRSVSSNGFRLRENGNAPNTLNNNNDDTGSVYSIYKQKIDSMFESDSSASTNNHNIVQAKIEKMFSEVAQDSGTTSQQANVHAFSVDYLGSVPLLDKVTSLAGLQEPLRNLYFSYKKITKSKKVLSGRLEISPQGLRVQYQGSSGDLEQMNSFPSIAVWSAVKFVIQENNSMLHGKELSYAFLPLITDPDNMDKQALFKTIQEAEKQYIVNQQHSPLFTVVMRKFGVQKQLECHGFVCQTSEDAIVIAATLYKSLVNHMKNKERKPKNKNGLTTCMSTASSTVMDQNGNSMPVRPPRRKRSSAASSVCSDTNSNNFNVSDTQPLLPSKPLKKSTKSKKAPRAPDQLEVEPKQEDVDAILPYEEPIQISQLENSERKDVKPKSFSDKLSTFMSKEQQELAAEMKKLVSDSSKGLKRVESVRKHNDETLRKKENSGDIFTKVTIPRSGSFLNTGGLTRYKNKTSRNNESASGGSPLGFKEIFHELSIQEGLHSMDDILSVIIDPEGMSFNDLKPIYKEFLLKLAVTLTKDELYLKSRSIMRRQKKKMMKRAAPPKKNSNVIVSGKFKRLKHIFQKNLIQPSSKKLLEDENKSHIEIRPCDPRIGSKLPESSISTSSYDTKPFRKKEEVAGKKISYRKKAHGELSKNRRRDRASTSEESDFFSLKRQNKYNRSQNMNLHTRNSSSGYVSCSECSYDSDTCTCTSADKCYCSLGNKNFENKRKSKQKEKYNCEDTSLTYCDCDTDSCAESNKCYCQYGSQRKSNKRRNSSSKSHHAHCTKMLQDDRHRKLCKKNSNTKSTRSLEYKSNPSEGYYEKLRSKQKYGSERILNSHYQTQEKKRRNSHAGVTHSSVYTEQDLNLLALQNLQMGKLSAMDYELLKLAKRGALPDLAGLQQAMCKGGFCENVRDYWGGGTRSVGIRESGFQKSAITTGACTEALSVKKSAEIAALFADIKLSQTTDITHLAPESFDDRYNLDKSLHQPKYSKPIKNRPLEGPIHPKPVLPPSNYARPMVKNKSKLYSAKNGLYTIQSQSDESRHSGSRRSSFSGETRNGEGGRKNTSSNIEDSLGYLP
ncbi:uncharacterized protein LOC126746651 isoform X2 [Anthonomus grandis grandis]|uniref:uncharacterized protein LOC126746651 isoform X2 n=1 Tax=Anthonomus grandis grandis TaxID=2921223 RepID=UPI0021659E1E|nr:uncharacterized protein LOC126746651 isoform X2 [Anthonomus grandis grandis]